MASSWVSCDVRCGGRGLESITIVESGPEAVVFRTAVDALGVEVHSSFAASQPDQVSAAHMVMVDGRSPAPLSHTTMGSPANMADQRRLFVEHLGYLRDALVDRVGRDAHLVVTPSFVA